MSWRWRWVSAPGCSRGCSAWAEGSCSCRRSWRSVSSTTSQLEPRCSRSFRPFSLEPGSRSATATCAGARPLSSASLPRRPRREEWCSPNLCPARSYAMCSRSFSSASRHKSPGVHGSAKPCNPQALERSRRNSRVGASILLCMAGPEEVWLPLVDEPVGNIVAQLQAEDPEIERLIGSPHRILAFRTFAYIRVGILLGELLFEQERTPDDADETWVEALLRDPKHHDALHREVRAVAEEIAADPKYADDEPLGPDEDVRERFRAFAREQLAGD